MICIMAAFKKEIADLLLISRVLSKKRMGKVIIYDAELNGKNVQIIKTGMGKRLPPPEILDGCDTLISTGFCGALVENLKSGDIVISEGVITADKDIYLNIIRGGVEPVEAGRYKGEVLKRCKYDISQGMINAIKDEVMESGLRIFSGITFTSPKVVKNSEEKKNLNMRTGAIAVDMEDYFRWEFARSINARFIPIRSVLDEIGDDIPGFKDGLRMGRKIGSIISKMDMVQQGIAVGVSALVKIL